MLTRRTPVKPGKPLARKTALKSSGALKRTGRLPQKRKGGPRRSSRVRDEPYLAFVRTLACCICGKPGPGDPHHATYGRGLSQKSDDDRAIPACRRCHGDAQDKRGRFKGWSKETMRAWHESHVSNVRALYLVHNSSSGNVPAIEEGDIA